MLTKPLVRLGAVAVLAVIIALGWFALQVDPVFAGRGREVIVTVHPGDSLATVAGELHAKGVIASPLAFRIDTLLLGAPVVVAGSYELRQGSSFAAVKAVIGNPPNVQAVEVDAGMTLREVALAVANDMGNGYANAFQADATSAKVASPFAEGASLEGLVGPGLYLIAPHETPTTLLAKMTAAFAKEAASVGLATSTTRNGLDAYQLVTAASIVEKEGYYPFNMPKVARVILNRLKGGGPLQMDSTVLYYLYPQGLAGGVVTHAMLATQTPYNTYLNIGLTPTPICTVSSDALRAILNAPQGPWLFFTLVKKDGTMAFSTTFAQQLANERLAQSRGLG